MLLSRFLPTGYLMLLSDYFSDVYMPSPLSIFKLNLILFIAISTSKLVLKIYIIFPFILGLFNNFLFRIISQHCFWEVHFPFQFVFYPHAFSLLLEREEGREKSIDLREKHWLVASQTSGLTRSLRMCADLESNLRSFGVRTMLHPTEPRQPGLISDD